MINLGSAASHKYIHNQETNGGLRNMRIIVLIGIKDPSMVIKVVWPFQFGA